MRLSPTVTLQAELESEATKVMAKPREVTRVLVTSAAQQVRWCVSFHYLAHLAAVWLGTARPVVSALTL